MKCILPDIQNYVISRDGAEISEYDPNRGRVNPIPREKIIPIFQDTISEVDSEIYRRGSAISSEYISREQISELSNLFSIKNYVRPYP